MLIFSGRDILRNTNINLITIFYTKIYICICFSFH